MLILTPRPSAAVLGIDAATPPSSVAVIRADAILAARTGPFGRDTDAWILPAIDAALEASHLRVAQLGALGVTTGPGTFTGIRVGIATAMGLGRGAGLPVIGVHTLEAIALSASLASASCARRVLATVDARRGQVYAAVYDLDENSITAVREPWIGTPDSIATVAAGLGPLSAAGTGLQAEPLAALPATPPARHPLAVAVGILAAAHAASGAAAAPLRPFYLREPDARPPADRRPAL